MNKYYHISLGQTKICKFQNDKPLFFDKKEGAFNSVWKKIGIDEDGYIEYSITIPSNMFTESIGKCNKKRILRITNNNFEQYKSIISNCKNRKDVISFLKQNNYMGLDTLDESIRHEQGRKFYFVDELIVFNFDTLNKLEIESVYKKII